MREKLEAAEHARLRRVCARTYPLTAVEMLPVLVGEDPLLALRRPSDRLRSLKKGGGQRSNTPGQSYSGTKLVKVSQARLLIEKLVTECHTSYATASLRLAELLIPLKVRDSAPFIARAPQQAPLLLLLLLLLLQKNISDFFFLPAFISLLSASYRSTGTLANLRLVHQRRLEVGQVPLGEGVLLDLLLLLPFVFERDHLIVGSQVVAAAAAELRHGLTFFFLSLPPGPRGSESSPFPLFNNRDSDQIKKTF